MTIEFDGSATDEVLREILPRNTKGKRRVLKASSLTLTMNVRLGVRNSPEEDWQLHTATTVQRQIECSRHEEYKEYECTPVELFELGSSDYSYYLLNIHLPTCPKNNQGPNCDIKAPIKSLSIIVRCFTSTRLHIFHAGNSPKRRLYSRVAGVEDILVADDLGRSIVVLQTRYFTAASDDAFGENHSNARHYNVHFGRFV